MTRLSLAENPERTIARTRRNRVESRRSRMNKEKEKKTGDERNEGKNEK